MSAPSYPSWLQAASRRRAGYGNLRVSDAERTEVADLLSKHYGDGRLDQAEFDQRMEMAMQAKTYADLNGLFDDLPQPDPPGPPGPPGAGRYPPHEHRTHPRGRGLLLIALIVVIAITAGHAVAWSFTPWLWFGPWLWIALLVLVAVYVARHRH
jgi:Domain of unknown function (DUF1707)